MDQRMNVTIETFEGPQSVEVAALENCPGLAITEQRVKLPNGVTEYAIIHIASGQCVVSRHTWRGAKKIADTIAPLTDWTQTAEQLRATTGLCGSVRQIVLALKYPNAKAQQ